MRACVRNDNGDCSKEFNVEQGLRQGCVLSPLLFKIFFAAALLVALQQFIEDPDILADLVHLQEQPAKVVPETAMECVRRAVWGMLYADDACIVSRSPQGLERMMTLVDVFGAFGLAVSENPPGNYELANPLCPCNANSIHHNGATIPSDDFLCLPRGRDYGKFEVDSRD